jgi:hypothetical protein
LQLLLTRQEGKMKVASIVGVFCLFTSGNYFLAIENYSLLKCFVAIQSWEMESSASCTALMESTLGEMNS